MKKADYDLLSDKEKATLALKVMEQKYFPDKGKLFDLIGNLSIIKKALQKIIDEP